MNKQNASRVAELLLGRPAPSESIDVAERSPEQIAKAERASRARSAGSSVSGGPGGGGYSISREPESIRDEINAAMSERYV